MLTNGGNAEGLFHGAFMSVSRHSTYRSVIDLNSDLQSGSPIPVGDIADSTRQAVYDSIVEGAGCANTTDSLQCLREVPYSVFNTLSNNTYSLFSYPVSLLGVSDIVSRMVYTEYSVSDSR